MYISKKSYCELYRKKEVFEFAAPSPLPSVPFPWNKLIQLQSQ